jgi:DNA-binding transcriptional LysR family regulator
MNSSSWTNNQQIDDLRLLRCFVTVADELHFGRAADRLGLPQSTISEQIKRFEALVGHPLFVRTTRRVALTALGETLLPEAQRAMQAVAHVFELGSTGSAAGTLPLLLGTATDIDTGELAETLPRLRRLYPNLRVSARVMRTADQVSALLEERLHLGFAWEPPEHPNLVTHLVGTTALVAFVPYDHPLARRKSIPIGILEHEPLVAWSVELNEWTHQRLHAIFRDHGIEPRFVVEARGFDQQVPHVLAGAGIGITAASISSVKHLPGLVQIPIRHRGGFRRLLVWRRNETHPGVAAILEQLRGA